MFGPSAATALRLWTVHDMFADARRIRRAVLAGIAKARRNLLIDSRMAKGAREARVGLVAQAGRKSPAPPTRRGYSAVVFTEPAVLRSEAMLELHTSCISAVIAPEIYIWIDFSHAHPTSPTHGLSGS